MNASCLTRELTAFGTWTEFKAAMEGGYIPTIRNGKKTAVKYNEKIEALRHQVKMAGFRYFDGNKTV